MGPLMMGPSCETEVSIHVCLRALDFEKVQTSNALVYVLCCDTKRNSNVVSIQKEAQTSKKGTLQRKSFFENQKINSYLLTQE